MANNMNNTIAATAAHAAVQALEKWFEENHKNTSVSVEDVRKAVHQILPSWKYVGWEPGLVNRRGWAKNYAQFRKGTERINVSFWEYDSYMNERSDYHYNRNR